MATIANLVVKLNLDDNSFQRGLQGTRDKLDSWGSSFRSWGTKLTAGVTTPIVGAGLAFVNWASDLEQAFGKSEAVFGDQANAVQQWSESTAKSYGFAQSESLAMASTYGSLFKVMGMSNEVAADYSMQLIGLSADMAAFNDVSNERASQALMAGLSGEYMSLRSMGVFLNEAQVSQEALTIAMADGREEITEADKVQARYNLIMEQTAQQHGQAEREMTGWASSVARARALMKNLGADIGRKLMPHALKLLDGVEQLVDWFSKLSDKTQIIIIAIAAFAAALGPLLLIIGMLLPGLSAMLAVIGFLASPIGLLVVAVGALAYIFRDELMAAVGRVVDIFTELKSTFEEFHEMGLSPVQAALAALQVVFPALGSTIAPIRQMVENLTDAFNAFKSGNYSEAFSSLWAAVGNLGASLKNAFLAAIDVLSGAPGWIVEKLGDGATAIYGWFSSQVSAVDWSGVAGSALGYLQGAINTAWATVSPIVSTVQSWFQQQFDGVDFVSVALSAAQNLGQSIGEAVGSMIGIASNVLDWLTNQINSVDWSSIGYTFGELLGNAIKAAIGMVVLAGTVLVHFLKEIGEVDWAAVAQSIWGFVKAAAVASVNLLAGMGRALYDQFVGELNALDWLNSLTQKGRDIINGFYEAVTTRWVSVRQWFINLPTMIFNAVGSLAKTLWERGTQALTGLYMAVIDKWSIGGVRNWFTGLGGKILDAVGNLGSTLYNAGVAVMQGLWDGLQAKWNDITGWLSSLNPADWKGPYRRDIKMLYKPGLWIMEGLQHGLAEGWDDVTRQLSGYEPALAGALTTGGSGVGGAVVNHNYYITPPELLKLMKDAEAGGNFARGFASELGMSEGVA